MKTSMVTLLVTVADYDLQAYLSLKRRPSTRCAARQNGCQFRRDCSWRWILAFTHSTRVTMCRPRRPPQDRKPRDQSVSRDTA